MGAAQGPQFIGVTRKGHPDLNFLHDMTSSQRAFLSGLIDYAGLFPPAALALRSAMFTYTLERAKPDAWILGRFILPVPRVVELYPFLPSFDARSPLVLSVLGYAPDSSLKETWANRVMRTLADARRYEEQSGGRVLSDRFEIRVPAELAADPGALTTLLGEFEGVLRSRGRRVGCMALEVPLLEAPETVETASQAIAEANKRAVRAAFALKLRCGGVTADHFPSVETLASALTEARRAGIPFKATAGLHHPVRQYREEVDTEMHGFVNVFGGAILAQLHDLDADALAEILEDTDASNFDLVNELRWKSLAATASEIADARTQFALSYGSCSFAEPREDLRRLGWL